MAESDRRVRRVFRLPAVWAIAYLVLTPTFISGADLTALADVLTALDAGVER